jgi:hypothetical protein
MSKLSPFVLLSSLAALPAGIALAAVPVTCNSSFTICMIPENVVVQLPFLGIAGDVVLQEPTSTTVSDVFRIFNNFVDTGGGTGLGNLAILYSAGDPNNPLPTPASYSVNAVTMKEAASGPTSFVGNGTTYQLDTAAAATALVYTGDTSADYHDPAQLRASLSVQGGGPIANAVVVFTLGSQSCSGTTNASGVAACSVVLNQVPTNTTVLASFNGIFGSDAASSVSHAFAITKEQTTLSYTGDTLIANGGTAHLYGVLLEDGVTPIAGRTVTFTLGTGGTAQTCTGTTDATGKAACTITPVAQPLGPNTVADSFAGDAFYLPASASVPTIQFSFLSSGAFVLGDGNAQTGTQQTFWSAQWAGLNQLSGGPAPDDFKGFADKLSAQPPSCGVTWTSRPGDSSVPPASVPSFMAVLVSSSISRNGSTESGASPRIVVVKTDPGYAGDPGHSGTGTVVAQLCP